MKKFINGLLILLVLMPLFSQAQTKYGTISGKIVSQGTTAALNGMEVFLPKLKLMKVSNPDGSFVFEKVPYGSYELEITSTYIQDTIIVVEVSSDFENVGTIEIAIDESVTSGLAQQLPTIALEESVISADDEGVSDQNISGVLTASRDPFLAAAAFTFGPLRYQLRGFKRNQLEVYMNGAPMNDLETGAAFWGQWGGLNDVFRNQTITFGLQPAEVGMGGLTGVTQVEAVASSQRQQTRISYSNSNRSYRHRLMLTHNTGLLENGWAFSVSLSKRWAEEGYIPGTFYDGYSYFLGISKKITAKSFLHFTTFGAPTRRGKAMPATQEAIDIAGDNFYNPNWGWLNGDKRNARVNNSFQPIAILNYRYKPNTFTMLDIAFMAQTGYNGNSALDWYNAMDPRPDYYRNLPSYYLYQNNGADPEAAARQRDYLLNNPDKMQIDWNRMYQANMMNIETVNGVTGKRSLYVIGEDREDVNKYALNINFQKRINESFTLYTGLAGLYQQIDNYRKLVDLLGGDFYVNLNQFAERTYVGRNDLNQNDLSHPDGIVREGDRYNYSYKSHFYKAYWWGQLMANYKKFDFFVAARLGIDAFQREGFYKNGLFPDVSQGISETHSFFTYNIKGGATYKIDGRNYVYLNGGIMAEAPTFDNTFFSPRTRNATIDNISLASTSMLEGGYLLRSPILNGRLSGFVAETKNATDIKRFYHEDYRTFVNYVMQKVDTRNLGVELAVQAKISPSVSATFVGTWMQVFYTNRPDVSIYRDNDTATVVNNTKVYIQDYYVASGPQSAYTLGLNYRSPKYWYASINFNYLHRNYIDINPSRHTTDAVGILPAESAERQAILLQEELPSTFTIDLFAGTSIKLRKLSKIFSNNAFVYINVGVNNLLNNKDIITGGFQQLRFDAASQSTERFPNKYFYGYGTNYFVNLSFKF